jgi:acyl-CoA reductase-like NAD-dependent aldehyde dehydrogenase
VCLSLQRLFVHESIAREFTEMIVEATRKLKVGNPLDKDCDVGPMISLKDAERAEGWVREAVDGGASVLIGGNREDQVLYPTVLTAVKPEMKVVCTEVFAPIVSIIEYSKFEDAVAMLEDSPYGLQAGVYTNDIRKMRFAIDRINVGGLMINDTSIFRVDHMPYGGNKISGIGREGVRFACEEMTTIRMVAIR